MLISEHPSYPPPPSPQSGTDTQKQYPLPIPASFRSKMSSLGQSLFISFATLLKEFNATLFNLLRDDNGRNHVKFSHEVTRYIIH